MRALLNTLLVTFAFDGAGHVAASAAGMAVGAAAFTGYCVAVVPLIRRWGPWRGSVAALGVWSAVAAAGYGLVLA